MCIFVGECPTIGGLYLPTILLGWQQIKAWISEPMEVDATSFGSLTNRFQWMWTNLAPPNVIQ
jgi:hypothetical protein